MKRKRLVLAVAVIMLVFFSVAPAAHAVVTLAAATVVCLGVTTIAIIVDKVVPGKKEEKVKAVAERDISPPAAYSVSGQPD